MTNVSEPPLFRLRVAYPKLGRLKLPGPPRAYSHGRAEVVRRAKLPYAVRRASLTYAHRLHGNCRWGRPPTADTFDVYLTELSPPRTLAAAAGRRSRGLRLIDAAYVELRRPALTAEINEVRYLLEVFVRPEFDVTDEALSRLYLRLVRSGRADPLFHRGKEDQTLDVGACSRPRATKF